MLTIIFFFVGLAAIPVILKLSTAFGLYSVIEERQAQVFTLFGNVLGVLDEPGLHIPVSRFGPKALLVPFFGKRYTVSEALRQHYLRNQM
ncbi:MAG: SPFH/Band 7/PHB domain protein, partial [Acidobacteria bacterium]|nr:SPFH/Band 7/PHB domain protein [Acidobacteriota bacterium]